MLELIMELEDEFLITIPNEPTHSVTKSVFTRQPFRISDLGEIVYLQMGSGKPERKAWRRTTKANSSAPAIPFSQLNGRWTACSTNGLLALFEPLESLNGNPQFRRLSDGMRCLLIPSAEVEIGSDRPDALLDERPAHSIRLDAFLIDAEPVSTTAYCRFLNSIEPSEDDLLNWFRLDPSDDRVAQMPIVSSDDGWHPVSGTDTLPMVLVSWFGANAYSLWANGKKWSQYQSQPGFLPSEAEWEYAAKGAFHEPSSAGADVTMIFSQHERGCRYESGALPMAPVHAPLGLSSFGVHHMAGNVWQWCRDWYAEDFYQRPESRTANPVNATETGVRSERGGSWVGPMELCRTTYRRGRVPSARGRCLGFRCISRIE